MKNALAYCLREEIELVKDVRRVSYLRVRDTLSRRFGLSSSENSLKIQLKSLLRRVTTCENEREALKIVFSTLQPECRYNEGRRLSSKEVTHVKNSTYLFVVLRTYLEEQFEKDEPSRISYSASKNYLLNVNFSRQAIDIAKPVMHELFDRIFQIKKSEDVSRMLNESHLLRSRIIDGRLYLGMESESSMLPKIDFDSQYLNHPIVQVRKLISCTVKRIGNDMSFVCNVGYNVTDSLMSCCDRDFNSSPCFRFRTVLSRVETFSGTELQRRLRSLKERSSSTSLVDFLEHAISCLENFKVIRSDVNLHIDELYRGNVMCILRELIEMCETCKDIHQCLLDLLGVKKSTPVSFSEMKLFQVSLNLSRSRYPMWNAIFLPGHTECTGVILGQIPTEQHVLMLKECANVRSVLSVVSDFEIRSVDGHQSWRIPGIDQKIINVTDFKGGGGVLAIQEGADYIQSQLRYGQVYVHCKAGRGRSALMVMGWLMKYQSEVVRSPLDAYWTILKNRPHINPDTLITHSKVKECFSYWNTRVLGLDKIFGGQTERGEFLFPDGKTFDLEHWNRAAIGAGFLSSTGYLRARDALYKLFGGTKAAEEMCRKMKPAKNANLTTPESRRMIWTHHLGIFCPKEIERAESMSTPHRLRDEDASKNTMDAILKFEEEILYPVRRITKLMDQESVFETDVTVVMKKKEDNENTSLQVPVVATLQLRICDNAADDHAMTRSISLFREISGDGGNTTKRKSRRRHALRTDRQASIVLHITSSKRRVMYVNVSPDVLTMKSLSMTLENELLSLNVQFHRYQDFQHFRDRLENIFLGKSAQDMLSNHVSTDGNDEEKEEKKEEDVENEEQMERIKNLERQIRHLVNVGCFDAAAAICGQNSNFKSLMIFNMLHFRTDRDVVKEWCERLDVSISRMEKRFEEKNLQINRTTMNGLQEILFVDSLSGVHDARKILLPDDVTQDAIVLGMDCEWKPCEARKTSSVCLVQFATRDRIVVLDLCTLDCIDGNGEHVKLLNDIMMREDVLIVGFALSRDFQMLFSSHSRIFKYREEETRRSDSALDALWPPVLGDDGSGVRRPSQVDMDAFMHLQRAEIGNPRSVILLEEVAHLKGHGKSPGHVLNDGLASLTAKVLNVPLDKTCQLSDWTERPLTVSQIQYAALDAFICVKIFDRLVLKRSDLPHWKNAVRSEFILQKTERDHAQENYEILSHRHVRAYVEREMEKCEDDDVIISELIPREVVSFENTMKARSLKTICCKARVRETNEYKFVVIVLPLESQINMRVLKKSVDKENMYTHFRLASFEDCCDQFGFVPGAMPAFGHRKHFDTFLAKCLYDCDEEEEKKIIIGGGSETMICVLRVSELKYLTRGRVVRVTRNVEKGVHNNTKMKVEARPISLEARIWKPKKDLNDGKKFVTGNEVQRLASLLRGYGIDATSYKHKNDTNLLRLAEAENRVILTREKSLIKTLSRCAIYHLRSNDTKIQIRDVFDHFGLTRQKDAILSRCSRCNSLGFEGPLSKSEIRKIVLPGVIAEHIIEKTDEFWVCINNRCRKIFWQGPKSKQAMSTLDDIMGRDDDDDDDDEVLEEQESKEEGGEKNPWLHHGQRRVTSS